jgi:hypothetical protein
MGLTSSDGATLRKSTSMENVNNPPLTPTNPTTPDSSVDEPLQSNPKAIRTGGLTREHSINQSRMRPPANSLASRPNVPHFSTPAPLELPSHLSSKDNRTSLPSPRSAPLQYSQSHGTNVTPTQATASTHRLNVETLNMKKLKSHQRHTSCPVDLGNYKGMTQILVILCSCLLFNSLFGFHFLFSFFISYCSLFSLDLQFPLVFLC